MLAVSLALVAGQRRAVASPPSAAEALYREGKALAVQAGAQRDPTKYDAAIVKFRTSFELEPNSTTLFAWALAEKRAGHEVDALHHFRTFLRMPGARSVYVDEAKSYIADLSPHVATFEIDAPAGAEIAVDGVLAEGKVPLGAPLDVAAGHHVIEARLNGKTVSQDVDVVGGSVRDLKFEFPAPPPPEPPLVAPVAVAPPAPTVPPSATKPSPPPSGGIEARTLVALSFAGTAVAAVAVGAGFTLGAGNASNRETALGPHSAFACATETPWCQQLRSDVEDHLSDTNRATGLYVVGGALAIGALATLLFWPSAPADHAGVGFAPVLGPGMNGARFRFDF
jgi:hypothetical protein